MNPTDPNEIAELVTLNQILGDNGFDAETRDDAFEFTYPCMEQNGKLGEAFERAAEEQAPKSGGRIGQINSIKTGGFVATFPDQEKLLQFMKDFSDAVRELCPAPEPVKIVTTELGMRLGAGAKPSRGIYG